MKLKVLGVLTFLLGLLYVVSVNKTRHSSPPKLQFHTPNIDLSGWLPHWTLPDWSPVMWVFIGITAVAILVIAVFAVYGGAKRDMFLMFAEENAFFTVMKGDLPHRFISGVKDMFVVQGGSRIGEVRPIPTGPLPSTATTDDRKLRAQDEEDYAASNRSLFSPLRWRDWLLKALFNMEWIGIYPFFQLRKWEFAYNKLVRDPGATAGNIEYHLTPKKGTARSVFFMNTVGMSFSGLETVAPGDQVIPVKVEILVTVEATNIYKMQFRTGSNSWLERLTAAIEDAMRSRVASHSYFALLKDGSTDTAPETTCPNPKQEIIEGIMAVINGTDTCHSLLRNLLGIKVVEIRFLSVELDEKLGAQREALTVALMAETTEEALGKGVIKKARAAAEATRLQADADNNRLAVELGHYSNHPGAVPGLFARSVGSLAGTVVLGDDASKRMTVAVPATHGTTRPPATT